MRNRTEFLRYVQQKGRYRLQQKERRKKITVRITVACCICLVAVGSWYGGAKMSLKNMRPLEGQSNAMNDDPMSPAQEGDTIQNNMTPQWETQGSDEEFGRSLQKIQAVRCSDETVIWEHKSPDQKNQAEYQQVLETILALQQGATPVSGSQNPDEIAAVYQVRLWNREDLYRTLDLDGRYFRWTGGQWQQAAEEISNQEWERFFQKLK